MIVRPDGAWALYVMAHGAGAGMRHPFLADLAAALAARGIATLRYEFPYMQAGRKRVDPPAVAHAAVRAAVAEGRALGLPILAGGKSFGGRMTSQAAAALSDGGLPGVRALVFLGFPLHPPDKPGVERAAHLDGVPVPMLFLQGTRDEFARLELLRPVCAALPKATLELFEGADHSFKARGRKPAEMIAALADAVAAFAKPLC